MIIMKTLILFFLLNSQILAASQICVLKLDQLASNTENYFKLDKRLSEQLVRLKHLNDCKGYDLLYDRYHQMRLAYPDQMAPYYEMVREACHLGFMRVAEEYKIQLGDLEFGTRIMQFLILDEKDKISCD